MMSASLITRIPFMSWAKNPTLRIAYITSFVFGFTSIAHENNLGAVASAIVGDSVTQYGWVIGLTLFGMALGFALSVKVPQEKEVDIFIDSEILLTFISGFSIILAHWGYSTLGDNHIWFLRFIVLLIALLVGIEDALLVRVAERQEQQLERSIGMTFWFTNVGGAIAGALYGQFFVPVLGFFSFALVLGVIDGVMVACNLAYFRKELHSLKAKSIRLVVVVIGLSVALMAGDRMATYFTQSLYEDKIVQEWTSPYGQKVLTCEPGQTHCKLFIAGQLQFSSKDEFMYHELLVHPAMSLAIDRVPSRPLSVLVLGGGDGLAIREILKYDRVENITLVDLDPDMTQRVAMTDPILRLNGGSLTNTKVRVFNQDAYLYVRDQADRFFDVVIIDLVDPDSEGLAKLYSKEFYQLINNRALAKGGVVVTQSTSPWYSAKAFWVINSTMSSVFSTVQPYRYAIPSFGDWGWQLASNVPFDSQTLNVDGSRTSWLTTEGWRSSLFFGKTELVIRDELYDRHIVSTVTRPVVYHYYNDTGAWDDWGDEQR